MKNDGWLNFVNSGSVSDYLKYKEQERRQSDLTGIKDGNNGSFNKGLGNQGANNRGE